jgi:hypothetical protein
LQNDVNFTAGQWIGTTQTHILQLMKELNVDQYPQHIKGTKLAQIGGTKIRPFSNYTVPTWSDVKWAFFTPFFEN